MVAGSDRTVETLNRRASVFGKAQGVGGHDAYHRRGQPRCARVGVVLTHMIADTMDCS